MDLLMKSLLLTQPILHIFVISREAMTLTFFCCHIVRMRARGCELLCSIASDDARRSYFYVVSRWANNNNTFFIVSHARASERWPRGIAKSEPLHVLSRWVNDFILIRERSDVFYALYRKKWWRRAYFYVISQKAMTLSRARACLSLRRRDKYIF